MVNWVAAQMPLLHWLVRGAGLRRQSIEIEPGTTMAMWVPKHKASRGSSRAEVVVPEDKSAGVNVRRGDEDEKKRRRKEKKKEKPAVVLVHGFAAEGLVTWQFQFGVLVNQYDVYIPDLFFFGGSSTASADRSPGFQARCLSAALDELGVRRCTAVGFSYGGMVAFEMAEQRPDLVRSLVISGSVFAVTDSISQETLDQLGFASSSELLMPESVKGLKALLSISMHKKLWFPNFLYKDFLEVMFTNRKERAELLEGLLISNKDAKVPSLDQRILLLWGENDNLFNLEFAKDMKEQLGENTTLEVIKKAGHLLHLERPCVYNRHLKKFLSAVQAAEAEAEAKE
ncbi:epoxide hydrolase 4-like [Zingiber officinale]|uniref:epoxide hydrolase 4-like n=1 Tax=Zingiber officinale TaxID=94328 RepID=UPI001C4C9738|nr:epoxide hydrolase 4-like [Zingiber officinale]